MKNDGNNNNKKAGDKEALQALYSKKSHQQMWQTPQGLMKNLKFILTTEKNIYLCQMVKDLETVLYGYS